MSVPIDDRLVGAPDAYRARAQTGAGVATTGATAIAAGVLFGGVEHLPPVAAIAAAAAVILLVLSLVFYSVASQYTTQSSVSGAEVGAELRKLVNKIRCWMRLGAIAGLLALVAMGVLVASTVAAANDETRIRIYLATEALDAVKAACPDVSTDFVEGRIRQDNLDSDSSTIELEPAEDECPAGVASLVIARTDILATVEVAS